LGKHVVVRVVGDEIRLVADLLHRHGIKYEVMIKDVLELLENHCQVKRSTEKETTIENFNYEVYHSVDEVIIIIFYSITKIIIFFYQDSIKQRSDLVYSLYALLAINLKQES